MFLFMFLTAQVELVQHLQGQALNPRASGMCTHLTVHPGSPLPVDSGTF